MGREQYGFHSLRTLSRSVSPFTSTYPLDDLINPIKTYGESFLLCVHLCIYDRGAENKM